MHTTHHPATPDLELLGLNRRALAAEYTNGSAAIIPGGRSVGTALILPGTPLARPLATMTRRMAWQGKDFDHASASLLNRITPFRLRAIKASVYRGDSLFDDRQTIVLDYSKTSWIARFVRDEIREIRPGLYLGYAYGLGVRWIAFALDFRSAEPRKADGGKGMGLARE